MLDALITRIRDEYAEIPGLRLSLAQVCRIVEMDNSICKMAMDMLVEQGFLGRTPDGAFIALEKAGTRRLVSAAHDSTKRRFRRVG